MQMSIVLTMIEMRLRVAKRIEKATYDKAEFEKVNESDGSGEIKIIGEYNCKDYDNEDITTKVFKIIGWDENLSIKFVRYCNDEELDPIYYVEYGGIRKKVEYDFCFRPRLRAQMAKSILETAVSILREIVNETNTSYNKGRNIGIIERDIEFDLERDLEMNLERDLERVNEYHQYLYEKEEFHTIEEIEKYRTKVQRHCSYLFLRELLIHKYSKWHKHIIHRKEELIKQHVDPERIFEILYDEFPDLSEEDRLKVLSHKAKAPRKDLKNTFKINPSILMFMLNCITIFKK